MGKLKNTGNRASEEFIEALDKHREQYEGTRNDYINEAVRQRVTREGGYLPVANAPHGVRKDARLNGWRSRLYPDRYQLVAIWDAGQNEWIIDHLHNTNSRATHPNRGIIRAETPYPLEIAVYAPLGVDKEALQGEVSLAVAEMSSLFDRED